jgi:site-specific recombinase XerD
MLTPETTRPGLWRDALKPVAPLADAPACRDNPPEKTRRGGRPKREAMTLTGLHQKFLRYCEVERQLAQQTIVAYRSDFVQFVESLREHGRFGLARQDTLATFSVEAIRDYQYDMVARGWSRATCRRRLIQLNRFGLWLVRRGHLKENPLGQIEMPRREKPLPKVLAWSVAEQVVAGESRVRNRAILAVLVYAGLRRGEVIRLNVGSLQQETSVALRVRGKGNKERVVGLPRQAAEAIGAYLATRRGAKPDEPMFALGSGDRITARVVSKAVARAGRRLEAHLYPHLFRHTYATRLHELGVDLLVIQGLLGHESVATTEIYTRVSASRQRQAIQALEESSSGRVVMYPPGGSQ